MTSRTGLRSRFRPDVSRTVSVRRCCSDGADVQLFVFPAEEYSPAQSFAEALATETASPDIHSLNWLPISHTRHSVKKSCRQSHCSTATEREFDSFEGSNSTRKLSGGFSEHSRDRRVSRRSVANMKLFCSVLWYYYSAKGSVPHQGESFSRENSRGISSQAPGGRDQVKYGFDRSMFIFRTRPMKCDDTDHRSHLSCNL
jgi:hypothetical protein